MCKKQTPLAAKNLQWRVNAPQLLLEVLNNHGAGALGKPMAIFGQILAEVGERAAELDDPKLNALMCRLAIYEIADPYNENYDKEIVEAIIKGGES